MDRNKIIKISSVISITGNSMLAALKIIIGFLSGSLSVIGDGLDSLTDIFISLITLVISFVIARPPDKEHPYGHYRAETIATSVLAFIIFFIGGQLVLSSLEKLINHEYSRIPDTIAVYVTVISIAGKILLSLSQYILGKKSGSPMIIANAKNMLNDILTSTGVLIGLFFMFYFNLPVIDKILAIVIGIWIMFTAVRIFMGTINEMMEGHTDMELYRRIFDEVKKTDHLFNPHRVRIRKLGFNYIIDMDLEADGNSTLMDIHEKVTILEKRLYMTIPNIYDIIIHLEPIGSIDRQEGWGLNEKNIC